MLNVFWYFEGEKHTGKVYFEKGEKETFISFVSDLANQAIENGYVDNNTAEEIKADIISNNYDMTDYEIF